MDIPALQVSDLSHIYKGQQKELISDFNLTISKGDRFGLFGPNGAGKTTLISLVTGLIKTQSGLVKILGLEHEHGYKKARSRFGYVPQSLSFFEELSPKHNLEYFGAMMGLSTGQIKSQIAFLLDVLGLSHVVNKPVKSFSGGMKRRVNLAIGVMHEPEILFLDEPTVGVDVQTRHAIIGFLKELNQKGTTLFYTSHHLSEAEELCNTVALIDEGELIAHDKLTNLLQAHDQEDLEGLFIKLTGKAFRD